MMITDVQMIYLWVLSDIGADSQRTDDWLCTFFQNRTVEVMHSSTEKSKILLRRQKSFKDDVCV